MTTPSGGTWDTPCGAGERYVCEACGKYTTEGGARTELRDASCMSNAVLCRAEKTSDGKWVAIGFVEVVELEIKL